ncbi:hypothetical protein [Streptomyces sp. NBC_00576]|uniref:hypothetical protein n=1 Tax=Streptomyces sp. NBC_00576 TaxID=2903665 RepID=UPI002E7FF99F|nr:hypothetical protein [Streptomyces sp. NBC_00576]WUB77669.1 hypothetical protein OG734_47720 [Streptomyces sp. NBC_00576]
MHMALDYLLALPGSCGWNIAIVVIGATLFFGGLGGLFSDDQGVPALGCLGVIVGGLLLYWVLHPNQFTGSEYDFCHRFI